MTPDKTRVMTEEEKKAKKDPPCRYYDCCRYGRSRSSNMPTKKLANVAKEA
jgi:hypothetical protein